MTDEEIAHLISEIGFYLAGSGVGDGKDCAKVLQFAADYYGHIHNFDNRLEVNPALLLH